MKIVIGIFIGILISFLLINYNKLSNEIPLLKQNSSCYEHLPSGLRIAKQNNEYVCQMLDHDKKWRFLWDMGHGIISWSYNPDTIFSDSCSAKQLGLDYVKQERKNKGFKPVN